MSNSNGALAFKPDAYLRKLLSRGDGATEADLWEASPVCIDWEPGPADALAVLRYLYQPADVLFIGGKYDETPATVADWCQRIEARGAAWPHMIPNPLTGACGTTKTGKPSLRADACVAGFRFAVIEFDNMLRVHQIAFWRAVIAGKLLDVAVLVDSGGKSIHAWVRVDSPNAVAWERDIERDLFARWLVPLGVDSACKNEARLSRLPGHLRRDTGRIQRLLYLDWGSASSAPPVPARAEVSTRHREG